jgi:hypothetical protein
MNNHTLIVLKERKVEKQITVSRKLLEEVKTELDQLHMHHYKDCEGGCPTKELIDRLNEVLRSPEFN